MRSKTTSLQSEYTQDGQGIGKAMKKVSKKVMKNVNLVSRSKVGKVLSTSAALLIILAALKAKKKQTLEYKDKITNLEKEIAKLNIQNEDLNIQNEDLNIQNQEKKEKQKAIELERRNENIKKNILLGLKTTAGLVGTIGASTAHKQYTKRKQLEAKQRERKEKQMERKEKQRKEKIQIGIIKDLGKQIASKNIINEKYDMIDTRVRAFPTKYVNYFPQEKNFLNLPDENKTLQKLEKLSEKGKLDEKYIRKAVENEIKPSKPFIDFIKSVHNNRNKPKVFWSKKKKKLEVNQEPYQKMKDAEENIWRDHKIKMNEKKQKQALIERGW